MFDFLLERILNKYNNIRNPYFLPGRTERDHPGTYVCFEAERIWMGRLIVMIMTGPVGVIVDGIIIVVGNSLKIEFHFA